MARLNTSILAASLNGYTIDRIGEFTNAVRNIAGIRIGGVFTYNNENRYYNMLKNPMGTRYNIIGSSAGGDFIGQKYTVDSRPLPNKEFLDSIGGLQGFTKGGYYTTPNSYVQMNMEEATFHKQLDLHDKQNRYGDLFEEYNNNEWWTGNLGISQDRVISDLDRLKTTTEIYKDSELDDFTSNLNTESNFIGNRKYLGDEFDGFGKSKTRLDTFYEVKKYKENINTATTNNLLHSDSIERQSYSVNTQKMAEPNRLIGTSDFTMYDLYDEDGALDINNTANFDSKTGVEKISFDESSDSKEKQTLLFKTNELFKSGKINSLINRFHTSSNAYSDNEVSEIQSAVDKTYGLSRGRNLKKLNETKHDGYDNPYCRVWTSHYQYSKMGDLIRHKGFGDASRFDTKDGVLRPFNGMERLNKFSSLQNNGLPRIAPMRNENDIKRCMFSIENLAWKDINKTATTEHNGFVLSEEQRGPNGGRIMWFPPYNLKVNENVSVNWNSNTFIGRGEPIYTYTNTERTGTLSFTVLVDHPSVVDSWAYEKKATSENEQTLLRFFAGCDDNEVRETMNVKEVPEENNTEKPRQETGLPTTTPEPDNIVFDAKLRYFVFFPNDFSGVDFYKKDDIKTPIEYLWSGAYSGGTGYEVNTNPDLGIGGCIYSKTLKGGKDSEGNEATWYYQVDDDKLSEKLLPGNYKDTTSFGLNKSEPFAGLIQDAKIQNTLHIKSSEINSTFTLNDLLASSMDLDSLSKYFDGVTGNVQDSEFEMKCYVRGYASSHGYVQKNSGEDGLAKRRARFLKKYLESLKFTDNDNIIIVDDGVIEVPKDNRDVSSLDAKLGRCADVIIGLIKKDKTPALDKTSDAQNSMVSEENLEQNKQNIKKENENIQSVSAETETKPEYFQYDDEYHYFKEINDDNDLIRRNLIEKVQFFDPAFHSITPEGFNARLTFLHQCTRQGPTMSASDLKGVTPMGAGNLAFGRPPVCVLRIGDFYFTKIIIDSLTIDYESNGGMQWDLNPEGIGIQPMLANITLGIKFLGGSDLSGPIARLQNAVSYNFFANTSAYDRRADYREGWIQENNDKANIWEPMINKSESNNTKHREYATVNKINEGNNINNN